MDTDPPQAQYSSEVTLEATPEEAFQFLDDPKKLSSHMGKSSWRMAGSRMTMELDARGGREVGSEIRMAGKMMGIPLSLKEVISERSPPRKKVWQTVGPQRLLVLDQYRMGFELQASGPRQTKLNVFIEYSLPSAGIPKLLGILFARSYAKWCTRMMARDAAENFARPRS
jgi:carbon monoxide dehydrogenase subunit G